MGTLQVKRVVRVVLDTNTVLSALLLANGRLSWLRLRWLSGSLHPLVSRDTTRELLRVLDYPKFKLSGPEQEDLLADYLPYCETVSVPENLSGIPECRDPQDTMFLKLAQAGAAEYLITGDQDLLVLAPDFPIPVMTPAQFKVL